MSKIASNRFHYIFYALIQLDQTVFLAQTELVIDYAINSLFSESERAQSTYHIPYTIYHCHSSLFISYIFCLIVRLFHTKIENIFQHCLLVFCSRIRYMSLIYLMYSMGLDWICIRALFKLFENRMFDFLLHLCWV